MVLGQLADFFLLFTCVLPEVLKWISASFSRAHAAWKESMGILQLGVESLRVIAIFCY